MCEIITRVPVLPYIEDLLRKSMIEAQTDITVWKWGDVVTKKSFLGIIKKKCFQGIHGYEYEFGKKYTEHITARLVPDRSNDSRLVLESESGFYSYLSYEDALRNNYHREIVRCTIPKGSMFMMTEGEVVAISDTIIVEEKALRTSILRGITTI